MLPHYSLCMHLQEAHLLADLVTDRPMPPNSIILPAKHTGNLSETPTHANHECSKKSSVAGQNAAML